MTSILELIPWETKPKEFEPQVFTVEWSDGSFEIPKYGYLRVEELNEIRKLDPTNALYRLTSKKAVELNKALIENSEKEGVHLLPVLKDRQCFALLSSLMARHMGAPAALSEVEEDIRVRFWHIISPYLDEGRDVAEAVPIRSVTIMLQRIRPGWTDDETKKLPPGLFNIIYGFYQEEESAGQPQASPDEQLKELEETLGKLREDVKSIAIDRTGPNSSGNAVGSGQARKNSSVKTTDSSQGNLSSEPLKQATRRNGKRSIDKS